ncbi:MAG: AAA family ATPase [Polyangiaceae bacterium]
MLACLRKDPARRPASAAELQDRLSNACRTAPAPAPAPPIGPPPTRLIAEGRHSVVVAFVETRGEAAPVAAAVTARGGFVPRQKGARYVAVFSAMDAEDPARAAMAAARELSDAYGARAALHVAEVAIRRRERGAAAAYGAALERPESWLPPEPWSGVFCTGAFQRLLPEASPEHASTVLEPTAESTPGEGEIAPDTLVTAPLTGREALLDALAAAVTATFEGGSPSLFTLVGDAGTGKTRLTAEAAAIAARAIAGARVVHLQAMPPGAGERDRLASQLLHAVTGERAPDPSGASPLGHHDTGRASAEALRLHTSRRPLAVLLDDAQWADDAVLDALELASLDASDCPLWVFVATHPRLTGRRASWGARTRHAERADLAPLEAKKAAELAAHLLHPAEYPPSALLDTLARWSGGIPASLVEIVQALKRAGLVRRRPGARGYQVATAALDALPSSPSWQWLATRRLAALPPELAACLRLGAVLGSAFSREELEAVQAALEQSGGAGTTVDAGAGLRARLGGPPFGGRRRAIRLRTPSSTTRCTRRSTLPSAWRCTAPPSQRTAFAGPGAPPEHLESLARHAAAAGENSKRPPPSTGSSDSSPPSDTGTWRQTGTSPQPWRRSRKWSPPEGAGAPGARQLANPHRSRATPSRI